MYFWTVLNKMYFWTVLNKIFGNDVRFNLKRNLFMLKSESKIFKVWVIKILFEKMYDILLNIFLNLKYLKVISKALVKCYENSWVD